MTLVVTIAGTDRTSVMLEDTLHIVQLADSFTFTAELKLYDRNSDISITAGSQLEADEITVVDGATTFFGGYVANQDIDTAEDGSREIHLQCQGYGILLNETYVEYEEYTSTADNVIINDIFDTYLPTIDSISEVANLVFAMDISFTEMTLAEIMDALCQRSKGRWYIDNEKKLHYFAREENDAGFDLSDDPDNVTSFSYRDGVQKREDAAAIVNKVRVIGADAFAVVRNDATSQALYGVRSAIVTDQSLLTTAEMEEFGDNILDKNKDPKVAYTVKTDHDGAVAGNEIDFRCLDLGYNSIDNGDDPLVIRELNIYWEQGDPVYEMTLGEAEITAVSRASYTGSAIHKVIVDTPLPIAARGWGHDMIFSATDQNTVAWTSGTITLAGGVGSFSIDAGNTGDIAAVTYIYLDADVSLTVLQTDTSHANAVGKNKIMVAVAVNVAEAGKNAEFQVFGGEGAGVFIGADNIAANSIDTNELVANSVTTAIIDAAAVTATEIAAGAVTATKLSVGELAFDAADGLLMLGPPWNIVEDSGDYFIQGTKGSRAEITGAIHLEQGRWQGTQGIVVEEGRTNYCTNPRQYDGNSDNLADDWIYGDNFGSGGSATKDIVTHPDIRKGWLQNYSYTAAAGDVSDQMYHYIETVAASFAEGDDCTFSCVLKAADLTGCVVKMQIQAVDNVPAIIDVVTSGELTVTGQLTRYSLTYEDLPANTDRVRVVVYVQQVDNGDSFDISIGEANVEKADYSTSFIAGNLGQGYAWSGTEDDSTSTRTRTDIEHPADPWLPILSGDSGSFMIWFQMPTDSGDMPDNWARIFEYGNFSDPITADWFAWQFDEDGDRVTFGIRRLADTSSKSAGWSAVSYSAGDWICAIAAWDSSSLILYWNGEELATITSPNLFADYDFDVFNLLHAGTTEFTNATLGFFCTWSRKLEADEVAKLYQLGVPPVDLGPMDKPGLYIYDGQFKIMSNLTGNRIEINPDEIAGYDSAGTKQFYLRSEDGKALAGAGAIYLDETGSNIITSTSEADLRAYKFVLTEGGTVVGGLYAYAPDANTSVMNVRLNSIASRSATINILADSPATIPTYISIKAASSANYAQILLTADSDAATKERIDFYADLFNFGIAAVPASAVSVDGYVPLYFNGTLRKIFYGTFS